MTIRGSMYTGTAVFTQGLQGTFSVTGPVEVKGSFQGKAVGDSLTLDMTYAIAANNCRGTMKLAGVFKSREVNVVEGPVNAIDSCVGSMGGTFRIGR
jgi:hypothetical protein